MHVVGHNDFAAHSMYCTTRPCDPMEESLQLADLVAQLYQTQDHDEVSEWYQFLLTLANVQDLTRGTFDAPETFDPATAAKRQKTRAVHAGAETAKNAYASPKHPSAPSRSVLQAFVSNLPTTVPEWKRQMAVHFEKMQRVMGYYASTKIVNEGWATLFMELLPPYTKYSTSAHAIEYGDLLQGVAGREDLFNPYWLGRECWRRVRERFNARPDIRNLPQLEKDRRFIKYAHEEIISFMNDYDFIRFALDEQWVFKNRIHLSRRAQHHEWDASLPPPTKPGQEQKIILSRDYKRIVDWIARKVADRRFQIPQIWLEDFHGLGRNILTLRHETVEGIPLMRRSMVQALYVISHIMERPVSLATVKSSKWEPPKLQGWDDRWGPPPPWWRPRPVKTIPESSPIRVEVDPSGQVRVFDVEHREGAFYREDLNELLTRKFEAMVEDYRVDQSSAINDDLVQRTQDKYFPFIQKSVDAATEPGLGLASHSPTASHALLEYANFLPSRIARAMALAAAGKLKVRRSKTGVRFRVLPPIPEFELDLNIAGEMKEALPPSPMDGMARPSALSQLLKLDPMRALALDPNADDDVDIGQGDHNVGDKKWGDSKKKQKGKPDPDGDEEGSPDEGDPDQGYDSGEPMDPTEVEIPADLFAKYMLQDFELPNMRRTEAGEVATNDTTLEGGVHRPHGQVLWSRTIPAAIVHAQTARRRLGLDYRNVPKHQLLREGMQRITPNDYVVSDRTEIPRPDTKALIVYVLGLTGSMFGRPQELSKEWVAYTDWLIAQHYSGIESRFVGYSDSASEFPRDKIFKAYIGGGNTDSTGFKLAEKIINEPQYKSGYNFYVFGLGDGVSYDTAETIASMKRLYAKCQYTGFVEVNTHQWGAVAEFVDPMKRMAESLPWYGYAQLNDQNMAVFQSSKAFFKGKKK